MASGKPVIVRGYPRDSRANRGAEIVGLDEMIALTVGDFVDRACHIIGDEDYRDALGQAAHLRARQEYTPARLGSDYLDFLNLLLP